jgi:hypothetical protein
MRARIIIPLRSGVHTWREGLEPLLGPKKKKKKENPNTIDDV